MITLRHTCQVVRPVIKEEQTRRAGLRGSALLARGMDPRTAAMTATLLGIVVEDAVAVDEARSICRRRSSSNVTADWLPHDVYPPGSCSCTCLCAL